MADVLSAWAGSQRLATAVWSGDINSTFEVHRHTHTHTHTHRHTNTHTDTQTDTDTDTYTDTDTHIHTYTHIHIHIRAHRQTHTDTHTPPTPAHRSQVLDAQIRAGLNMAMSGIYWWTTDVGGFNYGSTLIV